jgi:multidrug resistance efflux pump
MASQPSLFVSPRAAQQEPGRQGPSDVLSDGCGAEPTKVAPGTGDPPLDAHGLQTFLDAALTERRDGATPPPGLAKDAAPPAPAGAGEPLSARLRMPARRAAKVALGLAMVVIFGWGPLQTLLQASSVEAVVNTRLVTIRAPIDGKVVVAPRDGASGADSSVVSTLRIVNPRADRSRLDELRRQIGEIEDGQSGLGQRLGLARESYGNLETQVGQFRQGRIRGLEARVAALADDVAAAAASAEEKRTALERAEAMSAQAILSRAELARIERDKVIAAANESATRHRLDEASVELTAARDGIFVGDSYNDQPSSRQRADELRQHISDLSAELAERQARLKRLRVELSSEIVRYENLSDVEVVLPAGSRIFELMTSAGEEVHRGQDLVRLLDCSSLAVTANVKEGVYNQLHIGTRARFRPADEDVDYQGFVTNLIGVAGAPANFAIEPSALSKEPFRVTVAVPKLAASADCSIGRTGRVVFERGGLEPLTAATAAPAPARSP